MNSPIMTEEDFGTGDSRCPLVLLVDTSESMGFRRRVDSGIPLPLGIDQLNEGLRALSSGLKADRVAKRRVEILVVSFGGTVHPIGHFTLAQDWTPPELKASGQTPMGKAIQTGLDLANDRRRELQRDGTPVYRPWVFLLTDGEPTDMDIFTQGPAKIADAESKKRAIFWTIATPGADEPALKQLTPEKPVLRVDETDWTSLFRWMSVAISKVAKSNPGEQATIDPWTITT